MTADSHDASKSSSTDSLGKPSVAALTITRIDSSLEHIVHDGGHLSPMRTPSNFMKERMSSHSSWGVGEAFGIRPSGSDDGDEIQKRYEELVMEEFRMQLMTESNPSYKRKTQFGFMDMAPLARSAMESLVQDDFTKCFESAPREPWNWNFYLFPLYYMGVVFRYAILFPLRLICLLLGLVLFAIVMLSTYLISSEGKRFYYQQKAIQILATAFVMSWTAVIKYHGAIPPRKPGQIFVANHTSLIDVIILMQDRPYAIVGQQHVGVVGFCQKYILGSMRNLWFDRMAAKDRATVAKHLTEHIANTANPPLLLFPEGTCVNNEYVVMFKRGAFDLNATVVPIAIKYNKIFVDAFWNSRTQSFVQHLFRLMTSWCVVADVWYLEPQTKRPDETSIQFAARVKEMIARTAGLVSVAWDGYLKHVRPNIREKEARQKIYAQNLLYRFGMGGKTLAPQGKAHAGSAWMSSDGDVLPEPEQSSSAANASSSKSKKQQ